MRHSYGESIYYFISVRKRSSAEADDDPEMSRLLGKQIALNALIELISMYVADWTLLTR